MIRQRKNARICWDEKRKTIQVKQTIELEEINQKLLAKEGKKTSVKKDKNHKGKVRGIKNN